MSTTKNTPEFLAISTSRSLVGPSEAEKGLSVAVGEWALVIVGDAMFKRSFRGHQQCGEETKAQRPRPVRGKTGKRVKINKAKQ